MIRMSPSSLLAISTYEHEIMSPKFVFGSWNLMLVQFLYKHNGMTKVFLKADLKNFPMVKAFQRNSRWIYPSKQNPELKRRYWFGVWKVTRQLRRLKQRLNSYWEHRGEAQRQTLWKHNRTVNMEAGVVLWTGYLPNAQGKALIPSTTSNQCGRDPLLP